MFPVTAADQVALLASATVSVGSGVSRHVGSPNTIALYCAKSPVVIVDHVTGSATVTLWPAAAASVASLSGAPNSDGPYMRMSFLVVGVGVARLELMVISV